uniref:Uncharacterized protein n=1 Tax=Romanomermis culicivorax TaxID=13658 RepID=A0A915KYG0_ROMCU
MGVGTKNFGMLAEGGEERQVALLVFRKMNDKIMRQNFTHTWLNFTESSSQFQKLQKLTTKGSRYLTKKARTLGRPGAQQIGTLLIGVRLHGVDHVRHVGLEIGFDAKTTIGQDQLAVLHFDETILRYRETFLQLVVGQSFQNRRSHAGPLVKLTCIMENPHLTFDDRNLPVKLFTSTFPLIKLFSIVGVMSTWALRSMSANCLSDAYNVATPSTKPVALPFDTTKAGALVGFNRI